MDPYTSPSEEPKPIYKNRRVIIAIIIFALLLYILVIKRYFPGNNKEQLTEPRLKTPEELLKDLPQPLPYSPKNAQTLFKNLPAPAKNIKQIELELLKKLPPPQP